MLEYLNQVQGKLPAGVSSEIGPDATGVGWILNMPLSIATENTTFQNCALQDWFLKFELKTIPNVAEVASVGGVVKQYQIQVNPVKLSQYGISLPEVKQALESSNQRPVAHPLKWPKRSIWSVPAVIFRALMILITSS